MYKDQGMDFHYNQPQPHNDADSGPNSDNDNDEFSNLFKHVSGWFFHVPLSVCLLLTIVYSCLADS